MARLRCSTALATAAGAAAVLFAAPLPAAARERDVPDPHRPVLAAGLEDIVFPGRAPRAARIAAAQSTARAYTTADGYSVEIESAPAYRVDPAADRGIVDFLGSRLHGPELGSLSVYVAESRMYVPGESVQGVPVPAGASYSVEAEAAGFAAGRTLRSGGRFRVEWCRRRPVDRVKLTVRHRTGSGPFALSVGRPG